MDINAVKSDIDVSPFQVIEGEHVANGVGLRNRGGGKINLRGIPINATLNKAYLYWCVLVKVNMPPPNSTVAINGVTINGTLVGTGASPLWPLMDRNYVYRADVPLYLLYIAGNGDYEISGVPSSQGYGMSPWENYSGDYLAEGATLVIFFRRTGYNLVTYIYDAPISGIMFYNVFSANLLQFYATKSWAKFTMIGADGQAGFDVGSWYACSREESYFGGIRIAGPLQDSLSSPFQDADSDWNGHDGEP